MLKVNEILNLLLNNLHSTRLLTLEANIGNSATGGWPRIGRLNTADWLKTDFIACG